MARGSERRGEFRRAHGLDGFSHLLAKLGFQVLAELQNRRMARAPRATLLHGVPPSPLIAAICLASREGSPFRFFYKSRDRSLFPGTKQQQCHRDGSCVLQADKFAAVLRTGSKHLPSASMMMFRIATCRPWAFFLIVGSALVLCSCDRTLEWIGAMSSGNNLSEELSRLGRANRVVV